MNIKEARSILKANAALAVEIYRKYTRVGFVIESPIALAYDVLDSLCEEFFACSVDIDIDIDIPF